MREMPQDAWNEAKVAIAGPLLGSLGAAVIYAAGVATDSNHLKALAFLGFFLNLFNLLPVVPLDGGRIVAALHPALWVLGFAGLLGLVFLAPNPILIIIVIIAGLELWNRWRMRNHPELQSYYKVTTAQRAIVATLYFGLAALLVLGMEASHLPRDVLR
jgi:Zn-dependent protease